MKGEGMATSLDDLVNLTGVILAFEFTPDGTCTSYENVTREMAAMICRFCAAVTMNFTRWRAVSQSLANSNGFLRRAGSTLEALIL
jgi:roadblock/LC7 domain-containing protein